MSIQNHPDSNDQVQSRRTGRPFRSIDRLFILSSWLHYCGYSGGNCNANRKKMFFASISLRESGYREICAVFIAVSRAVPTISREIGTCPANIAGLHCVDRIDAR